jgi:Glycerol-3-phosphate dehydrogenase
VAELPRRTFDLLVIGGGIYGAWTAADAARRGLSVALIEARDWAAGTSSSSSKLIHGGLRYLEHFEFGLVRESLGERRLLSELAPHLVRPLRFMLPVWRGDPAGPFKLSIGLRLYDLLAGRGQPVGPHRRWSRRRLLQQVPQLRPNRLVAGFDYGDCQEDDARLVLEVVAAAQAAGALCVSRARADSLLHDDAGAVVGARVHDQLRGEHFEVRARAVAAPAGPWIAELLGELTPPVKRVRGVHLILPAIAGVDHAFALRAPQDGRAFFVVPWYGRTLVGTTESEVREPEAAPVSKAERDYLLDAVRARLPGCGWDAPSIIGSFAGVRTLQDDRAASLAGVTREFELLTPAPGLWLPIGGKYTTARREAAGMVDRIAASLGHRAPSDTSTVRLPGAPSGDLGQWQREAEPELATRGLDARQIHHLLFRYGTRVQRIAELIDAEPALSKRVVSDLPFIAAELALAVRDEGALDAEDALRRRLPLRLLARRNGTWQAPAEARVFDELARLRHD